MWFLLLWGLGLGTAGISLLINGMPKDIADIYTLLLQHQFVVTFGLIGIIGIFENILLAKKTAKMVGWPHSPYQIKYGFCQLCLGFIGVMTLWIKGTFWIAALVTMYMYGLSGFWTHTAEMIKNKKIDLSNMTNLIMNFFYQLFITVLSIGAEGIW